MNVLRIIYGGIPYRLRIVDEDAFKDNDDWCELCALKNVCMRNCEDEEGVEGIRYLCGMGELHDVQYSYFEIDFASIDKTLRELIHEKYDV